MNISIILDKAYDGSACGVVWVVDSGMNRDWFERRSTELDPNSAIFSLDQNEPIARALYQVIECIAEHYPEWKSISVIGLKIDHVIRSAISEDFQIEEDDNGLVLR